MCRVIEESNEVTVVLNTGAVTFYKSKDPVASYTKSDIDISEEVMEIPECLVGISKELDGKVFTSVIGNSIYCRYSEIPEEYIGAAFLTKVDDEMFVVTVGDNFINIKLDGNKYTLEVITDNISSGITYRGEFR